MKVLFIVQGEGRGHLTQAISMEGLLRRGGHQVVKVMVGKSNQRQLPAFFTRAISAPVERFSSPNFLPSPKNKRNSLPRSVAYNMLKVPAYASSMALLHRTIEESGADLVVNFYELLTGLVYLTYRPSVPQVSIGHQYLFIHHDFAFPRGSRMTQTMLRLFTRTTAIGARQRLALSFRQMDDDLQHHIKVVPPLLRREVLDAKVTRGSYVHGYMVNAGFGQSIERWHREHKEVPLRFFWDKKGMPTLHKVDGTLSFHQLDDVAFLESLAGCRAYATTAGFESVCEAMYLGKPVMMVPAHIEQDCNAYDAQRVGAGIVATDFDMDRLILFARTYQPNPAFQQWVERSSCRIIPLLESAAVQPAFTATGYIYSKWNSWKMRLGIG